MSDSMVGEIKEQLTHADQLVEQVAGSASSIGTEVDNIPVLTVAEYVDTIPNLPALEVPASFEAAAAHMNNVAVAAGKLGVGALIGKLTETDALYRTTLHGSIPETNPPVKTIYDGLMHMGTKAVELVEGQGVLIKESGDVAAALSNAGETVKSKLAESRFDEIGDYVGAQVAANATTIRDTVEPARAALTPTTEEIAATAQQVKETSEGYRVQI